MQGTSARVLLDMDVEGDLHRLFLSLISMIKWWFSA